MGNNRKDKGKKHSSSSRAGSSSQGHRERTSDPGENVQNPGQPPSSGDGSGGYFMDVLEQDPQTGNVMVVKRWFKSDTGPAEYIHDQGGPTMPWNQPYSTGNDIFDNGAAGGSRPNYPPTHMPRKFVQGKVGRAMQGWPPNPSGFEGAQADLAASYPTSHAGSSDAGGLPLGADYINPGGLGMAYADSSQSQTVSYAFGGAGMQGHWVDTQQTLWCSCAQSVPCRCEGGMNCRCLVNSTFQVS